MDQKEKIDFIARDLPMIAQIKDKDLSQKVADVWLRTIELSPWESISDIPFSDKFPQRTLKEHVNATTEAALEVSRIFKKHHRMDFDEDFLIAFALIHDVDKALKYVKGEKGGIVVSEIGAKIQHGVMSAMIARDCGFPIKMLHLLITHTPSQNMQPAYDEGVLFFSIDQCDWDMVSHFEQNH